MTVAKGMKVNLFASEKEFPELAKPVQMAFDAKGRLWVAAWPSYPHWKPKEEMNDKLLIFEDTDGDGKADKKTVFADNLHCPTGFEFSNGGVLVAQAPDLMFLKDTDGDGKADVRARVLSGLDSADTHHTVQQLRSSTPAAPSTSRRGRSTTPRSRRPTGPPSAAPTRASSATSRSRRSSRSTSPTASPTRTATSSTAGARTSSSTAPAPTPITAPCSRATSTTRNKHADPPQVYQQRTRPCPGVEILVQPALPRGDPGQPAGRQRDRLPGHPPVQDRRQGRQPRPAPSSSRSSRRPTRTSARPTSKIGPDGAIYFLDWQNPIIGHMQHNLRDPSRDRTHGRIYRVTYEGRAPAQAREDRRRADREAARPAQGARGPRPLPGQDRAGRPRDRRGHRRR